MVEAPLDDGPQALAERKRGWEVTPAVTLLVVEVSGAFDEGEGVAAREGPAPAGHALDHTAGGQEGDRGLDVEAAELDRLQTGVVQRWSGGSVSEDHHHAVGVEAPGREEERVEAGPVEPVGVVHDDQQRLVFGGGREKGERPRIHGGRHRRALVQPERGTQRGPLRCGQVVEITLTGPQDVREPGEGQVALELDTDARAHRERPGAGRVDDGVEQRRLPAPGLTPHDPRAGPCSGGVVEHRHQAPELCIPPEERPVFSDSPHEDIV
jgi:hypothetical protein